MGENAANRNTSLSAQGRNRNEEPEIHTPTLHWRRALAPEAALVDAPVLAHEIDRPSLVAPNLRRRGRGEGREEQKQHETRQPGPRQRFAVIPNHFAMLTSTADDRRLPSTGRAEKLPPAWRLNRGVSAISPPARGDVGGLGMVDCRGT
jgi:hypothetical protein